MKRWHKGLIVAVVQLAIVCTLGAKLLYDRATRPRVWVRSAPYDPQLPIRGRYISLQLEVDAPGITPPAPADLHHPILFFIPEHVPDPSRQPQGSELWVEVTLPKRGPPRPIRLAVKRGETFTVLDLR